MGVGRGFLSLMGCILLLVSLALAFSWFINLPGVIVAIQRHQNYVYEGSFLDVAAGSHWPNVVRSLAAFTAIALGVASIIFLMLARRSRGTLHMLRAPVAAGLLFVALIYFAGALPHWSSFQLSPRFDEWIARYLQAVDSSRAILAAVVWGVAMTLLVWPPRQKNVFAAPVAPPASEAGKV